MKVAFIHYHLKTGGVTTVLRQQIDAVQDSCQVLVLTGELPKDPFPADIIHIPGLGYTDPRQSPADPKHVTASVQTAIRSKWRGGCDLFHVHNPTLAKNISFLKILKELKPGTPHLFLQIHDFAEDGRPAAYFTEDYVSDCHYGVINSRDYRILLQSGLKKAGVHEIPNTVEGLGDIPVTGDPRHRILYPIRARRRKNIGEAILLSVFFKAGESLTITLPPISPVDLRAYAIWKEFAAENRMNVAFDAGRHSDFKTLVSGSASILTTSITEGFGFSFLEPWTAGKLLWGRKLPQICDDFENKGIDLRHLYTRLRIPIGWIGEKELFDRWHACILENSVLYGYRIRTKQIAEGFDRLTRDRTVDFGLLDEKFQKQVISRVLADRTAKQTLIALNPFLAAPGKIGNDRTQQALIHRNREAISRHYSRSGYRKNLLDIYEKVIRTPVRHHIDKDRLLRSFFDLNHFSLLKWCDHVE